MLNLSLRLTRHEDVVAERYPALRRAALHLARGDEAEAGDLLHDACVRFLLLRPELDRIDHLDGYLYAMLRNVRLSRQRQHARRRSVVIEAIEVELLGVMVGEPGPGERLRMHDDLTRLVAHMCMRSRASRGASAWILRCIHGYYPTEIAHVMKTPPRAVDSALHVARREALGALRQPPLHVRPQAGGTRRWRDLDLPEPEHAIDALRVQVFASVDGVCLTSERLADLYRPDQCRFDQGRPDQCRFDQGRPDQGRLDQGRPDFGDPVATLVLAHIVACAGCLDRINRHLGLSSLAVRDPLETTSTRGGRGGGPPDDAQQGPAGGPDGEAGDGAGEETQRPSRDAGPGTRHGAERHAADLLVRRSRETLASIVDHVPRTLRIAANGLYLGAQPVVAAVTEQELTIRLAESLAFIEIFDERGVLVCYWPAQVPAAGAFEERTTIELTDDRRFELQVSLADDCPLLRVRYTDLRLSTRSVPDARATAVSAGAADALAEPGRLTMAWGVGGGATPLDVPGRTAADGVGRAPHEGRRPRLLDWIGARVRAFVPWSPRPRFALAIGVLFLLWLTLVGPTTTWAALTQLGRAAAAVLQTLIGPRPPAPPPVVRPGPSSSPSSRTPGLEGAPAVRSEPAPSTFSASELADLEMLARVTLHRIAADLGEDLTLVASQTGITVRGVVANVSRRQTIARAFAGVRGIQVRVQTVHEVAARAPAAGTAARTGLESEATAGSPVPDAMSLERSLVDRVLLARFPAPATRAAFVAAVLARADDALTRAWALRRLAERYPPREGGVLSARSREALVLLRDDHATAVRAAVDALLGHLAPLFDAAAPVDVGGSIPRVFAAVEASHRDLYALLTDADMHAAAETTGAAPPALVTVPNVRILLARLQQLQAELRNPDFGREIGTRD